MENVIKTFLQKKTERNWNQIEAAFREILASKGEDDDVIDHVINSIKPLVIGFLKKIADTPGMSIPVDLSSNYKELIMSSHEDALNHVYTGVAEGAYLLVDHVIYLECELYKCKKRQT